MEVLAIIPARGGSKGIPHKNLQPLAGKPLVAHTILQAQAAKMVTRTVVSTDNSAIAEVARHYGAEVLQRPAAISGDTASSEAALLHVLDELERHEQYQPELVAFLQCTSPLRLPRDIDEGIARLMAEGADSLVGVTPFSLFLWREAEDGRGEGINHNPRVRPLRQEMEPQYLETGVLYVMRAAGFRAARHRFFGKTVLQIIPNERCLDINSRHDFLIAETMLAKAQTVSV